MLNRRPLLGIDLDPEYREFEKSLGDCLFDKLARKSSRAKKTTPLAQFMAATEPIPPAAPNPEHRALIAECDALVNKIKAHQAK